MLEAGANAFRRRLVSFVRCNLNGKILVWIPNTRNVEPNVQLLLPDFFKVVLLLSLALTDHEISDLPLRCHHGHASRNVLEFVEKASLKFSCSKSASRGKFQEGQYNSHFSKHEPTRAVDNCKESVQAGNS